MAERIEDIRDDLAFMRGLVQQDAPGVRARSGAVLAFAGFLFAACSLEVGAAANGWLPQTPWTLGYAWFIAMGVFLAGLFLVLRRGPEGGTVRSRATGTLWSAVGMAIGVLVLSAVVAQAATGSPFVWTGLPSTVFTLYGAGWLVAATLSGKAWERWVGVGGFAAAVAMAALAALPQAVFFGYALGLVLLLGLPGLAILRSARTA